jgi:hypothetical protein
MENLHNFVYSSEVLEFVKKCKSFTDLLEDDMPGDRKDFIISLLRTLPDLYSSMISLPPNEPVFDAENEKFVTEEKWSQIFQKVASLLGSQNEYLDVPEDDEYDRLDVISRELSEDISDIYQDIRDFTEVFRVGTEEVMNDVLWDCRINFENYWGKKLLRASLNLHKIMIRDEEILEKMDQEFEDKSGGREYKADDWFITKRQNEAGDEGEIQE